MLLVGVHHRFFKVPPLLYILLLLVLIVLLSLPSVHHVVFPSMVGITPSPYIGLQVEVSLEMGFDYWVLATLLTTFTHKV